MPLTIFNVSTVDHLYIGKDTVIAFAEEPILDTYSIELASKDKTKEPLAKHIIGCPRGMKHYLKSHMKLPLFVLQQMYQNQCHPGELQEKEEEPVYSLD